MTKRRLGELLGAEGLITEDQLRAAIDEQRKSNLFLGEALVKLGFVSEEVIAQTIVQQFSLPFMPAQNYTISLDVLITFPQQMYYEYQFIAVDKIANTLIIVGAGLMNHDVLDELERVSKCKVCQYVSTWKDIRATLERHSKELKQDQEELSPLGTMLLDHTPQPVSRSTLPAAAVTPPPAAPALEPFRPASLPAISASPPAVVQLPPGLVVAAASTAPAPTAAAGPPPSASEPAAPSPIPQVFQASGSSSALRATGGGTMTRLSAFAAPRPSVKIAVPGLPAGPESPVPQRPQPSTILRPPEPSPAGAANAAGNPAPVAPKVNLPKPTNKTGLLGLFKSSKTETKPQ